MIEKTGEVKCLSFERGTVEADIRDDCLCGLCIGKYSFCVGDDSKDGSLSVGGDNSPSVGGVSLFVGSNKLVFGMN